MESQSADIVKKYTKLTILSATVHLNETNTNRIEHSSDKSSAPVHMILED